jgi:hypothetical protein
MSRRFAPMAVVAAPPPERASRRASSRNTIAGVDEVRSAGSHAIENQLPGVNDPAALVLA